MHMYCLINVNVYNAYEPAIVISTLHLVLLSSFPSLCNYLQQSLNDLSNTCSYIALGCTRGNFGYFPHQY